ncbi:hypothetical protein J3R83DRAFT_9883 [Lanmaoa asiatica]|nr:hypothetical protein J3R83DRAFT_9883 [Lanmaoa asiatica]
MACTRLSGNILVGLDGHIALRLGLSKELPHWILLLTVPSTPSGTCGAFYPLGWQTYGTALDERRKGLGRPRQGVFPADTTTALCSTAEYLAPEIIQGLLYSYEVDRSFGMMLYEMITGIVRQTANASRRCKTDMSPTDAILGK